MAQKNIDVSRTAHRVDRVEANRRFVEGLLFDRARDSRGCRGSRRGSWRGRGRRIGSAEHDLAVDLGRDPIRGLCGKIPEDVQIK